MQRPAGCLRGFARYVWIGSDLGLEGLTSEGFVEPWSQVMPWPHGLVDCLAASRERLWVGASQELVCITRDDNQQPLVERYPGIGFVKALAARATGHAAWAVTAAGELLNLSGGQPRKMALRGTRAGQSITCVGHAADNLLVAGTEQGLLVLDGRGSVVADLPGPSPTMAVAATATELWSAHGTVLRVYLAA